MSKRFIASVTLSAFSLLAVPVSAMPGSSSSLLTSSGRVLSQQGGSWTEGVNEITSGTRIRTAADGQAVVSLPNGSLVRLAPMSEVAFETISDNGVVVRLERGRVIGHAGSGLKVKTDRTVTQASVGEFVVNTSSQGTQLDVLAGDAALSALDGGAIAFAGDVSADVATGTELQDTQTHANGKQVAQGNNDDDNNNNNKGGDADDGGNGDGGSGDGGGGGLNGPAIGGIAGGIALIIYLATRGNDNKNPTPSPSGA